MKFSGLIILVLFPLFFLSQKLAAEELDGQQRLYWVFFTDKDQVSFDPHSWFDPLAIERRIRHGVCLYDSLDFPVREHYIEMTRESASQVRVVSRWLNAVSISATACQVEQLSLQAFVKEIKPMELVLYPAWVAGSQTANDALPADQIRHMITQVTSLEGNIFHENGIDGTGLRIAIFDGGFPGVDTHPVFRHIMENDRIVKTWDFHREREDVFRNMSHGTMVLSTLGGIYDSIPMGLATGAEYLLARTEIWREPFFEEEYWMAAIEWADRNGAHIVNSSLGYTYHRYFPEQMDGQTSLVARAAEIGFSRGMLIVNSAGNSGTNELWRIVSTPADSPYVLSVGAMVYPEMLGAAYSSRGPTADGRLKPNVTAIGNVVAAGSSGITNTQGTSFSGPLVAGFAACLWQMFPEWSNQDIFNAMQQSAHLYPYYDFHHGYGIPKAGYFFSDPGRIKPVTFSINTEDGFLKVRVKEVAAEPKDRVIKISGEDQAQAESDDVDPLDTYLYYHIRSAEGKLQQFFVVQVYQQEVLSLPISEFKEGEKIMVHYRGFTSEYSF